MKHHSAEDKKDIPEIAVIIPCYNEELTIGKVVTDFKRELPQAEIFVFDNASTDNTAKLAAETGATVMYERRRGKGFVVQSMFQKVEADIYIMVDGDDTYPADRVHSLIEPVANGDIDMCVGSRIAQRSQSEFRPLNWFGNKFYQVAINMVFGATLTDILSGYRCMSRRFVKGVPLFVTGFEVETEITIKALERGYQLVEVPVDLRARPAGSHSKIRITQDGIKILWTILALLRDYKPLTFFGVLGLFIIAIGLIPGSLALRDYFFAGAAPQIAPALLATGLVLTGVLVFIAGVILHTINRRFQELEYQLRLTSHDRG
jgi:glycosyltransferase involved in cell wall biosynthesis